MAEDSADIRHRINNALFMVSPATSPETRAIELLCQVADLLLQQRDALATRVEQLEHEVFEAATVPPPPRPSAELYAPPDELEQCTVLADSGRCRLKLGHDGAHEFGSQAQCGMHHTSAPAHIGGLATAVQRCSLPHGHEGDHQFEADP